MGSIFAQELSEMDLTLEQQVSLHFSANCYPPVPKIMITPALEAIEACDEGEFSRMISLPDGVTFRNGEEEVTASQIINSLRLEAFISYDDDDFEEFEEVR